MQVIKAKPERRGLLRRIRSIAAHNKVEMLKADKEGRF